VGWVHIDRSVNARSLVGLYVGDYQGQVVGVVGIGHPLGLAERAHERSSVPVDVEIAVWRYSGAAMFASQVGSYPSASPDLLDSRSDLRRELTEDFVCGQIA
jgi:hypothetical protein